MTDCFAWNFGWNASFSLTTTSKLFRQALPSYTFSSRINIFFLPLTTLATSGTENSRKSAPTRFAYSQEWNSGSPNYLRESTKTTSSQASNTFVAGKFKSISCNHFTSWSFYKWLSDTFLNMKTSRVIPLTQKKILSPEAEVSCKSTCVLWRDFFNSRLNWSFLRVLIIHVLSGS